MAKDILCAMSHRQGTQPDFDDPVDSTGQLSRERILNFYGYMTMMVKHTDSCFSVLSYLKVSNKTLVDVPGPGR